jgi:3-methyladenine DNA glycosylase AlkD
MGVKDDLRDALSSLERASTRRDLANLERFGITATRPFGVSMANLQVLAKRLGRNHALAAALWKTGRYEARMLAALVDEPARVTPSQMDRWCRDFDNWGICDTVCLCLFDRTPHAFGKVTLWATRRDEFVKRGAFALLAGLAVHDKQAGNEPFVRCLPLIETAASDDRNFVKKGVNWSLRTIGRRNRELHGAALALARRLSGATEAAPRWIGKDAVRELTGPVVTRRLAALTAGRASPSSSTGRRSGSRSSPRTDPARRSGR